MPGLAQALLDFDGRESSSHVLECCGSAMHYGLSPRKMAAVRSLDSVGVGLRLKAWTSIAIAIDHEN